MCKGYRERGERESGESVNWTPACISSPLDQLSGAIKTPDMHTEGRGLKEVMVEQEAAVLPSHACDDGCGEIKKDRRGKREKVGATWRTNACGCLEEEQEGASQNCTSFEVRVHTDPPKTTSDSNTCECLQTDILIPSPKSTSIVLCRAIANTQVIDSDGC